MLQGGIHNYLDYCSRHNLTPLYKGVNYVFDARQSLGSSITKSIVSQCLACGRNTASVGKCKCHAVVVACDECRDIVWCCIECRDGKRPCSCEIERGLQLTI